MPFKRYRLCLVTEMFEEKYKEKKTLKKNVKKRKKGNRNKIKIELNLLYYFYLLL